MYHHSTYCFPPPNQADEQGLLAAGGDLSPECLLTAYYSGIFPWFDDSQPLLWWSPDPRMVLFPERLHISKSMRRLLQQQAFQVTFNQSFSEVMKACAKVERPGQDGTWITADMVEAYEELHRRGFAQSVEVWRDGVLVGGLYGIFLKGKHVFCGESMFSTVSNASKYGFITLVKKLRQSAIKLIDCQVYSSHLESLGAEEISREEFLCFL